MEIKKGAILACLLVLAMLASGCAGGNSAAQGNAGQQTGATQVQKEESAIQASAGLELELAVTGGSVKFAKDALSGEITGLSKITVSPNPENKLFDESTQVKLQAYAYCVAGTAYFTEKGKEIPFLQQGTLKSVKTEVSDSQGQLVASCEATGPTKEDIKAEYYGKYAEQS